MEWRQGRLLVAGEDVTNALQAEAVGKAASQVASLPYVRTKLLPLQRQLASTAGTTGALVDGRDIGTVVFPDAALKIFLTASLEERSKRRLSQLGYVPKEMVKLLEEIKAGIAARDEKDSSRAVAPLIKAQDAIEIDTSSLSLEQVVDRIISLLRRASTYISAVSRSPPCSVILLSINGVATVATVAIDD